MIGSYPQVSKHIFDMKHHYPVIIPQEDPSSTGEWHGVPLDSHDPSCKSSILLMVQTSGEANHFELGMF